MGYGKKGWFKTYITMMKNSFNYAKNVTTKIGKEKWYSRGLSLLFAILWHIFIFIVFIGLPILVVTLIVLKIVGVI